ncbi:MAG TPA: serine hydrolase domain-containing protein [Pyrinomonadaceae bacterium]|nr:serine hydrolase domain-containing protein [Pyrinomonadaceae bacterium]
MSSTTLSLLLCLLILITCAFGNSAAEPLPVTQDSRALQQRIHRVEDGLLPSGSKGSTLRLADRMTFYKTPGVSIAVINDGKLEWARGYGVLETGSNNPVTTATLFQACSISKPIAAMAALSLVEQGKLDLDEDVNQKLHSWKVPPSEFTKEQKVTLRRLLSHTAGTTVSGLRGYAFDEQLPTLRQILDGVKPANSEPIRVDTVPGTQWRYSGGGFLVLQQLLIDVQRKPFPEIMRELVLQKLEMKQSTYEQRLPLSLKAQAAKGHQQNGEKVNGDWFIYPEMAAGGLWTTPSDLARIVIELQKAKAGRSRRVLSRQMVNEMLSGQMPNFPAATISERYGRPIRNQGLGFRLEGEGRAARFSHHGGNTGYRCFIVAYNELGQGAVVMTNSDNGFELVQEIIRSIAKEYSWPDYPFEFKSQ